MTRFNITLDQGVDLVLHAFKNAWGGEIFVPKIPSYKIMDVADAIAPGIDFKVIGVRPGEKLHEEMITETDSLNTLEFENYFVILPTVPQWKSEDYLKRFNGKRVDYGFKYSSGTNPQFLSVEEIRGLVRTHVDPTFNPSHAGKHL
jgi:FlaA1/EpsC-like NDP-sugar epimerase